jgi:hypothetical protein
MFESTKEMMGYKESELTKVCMIFKLFYLFVLSIKKVSEPASTSWREVIEHGCLSLLFLWHLLQMIVSIGSRKSVYYADDNTDMGTENEVDTNTIKMNFPDMPT